MNDPFQFQIEPFEFDDEAGAGRNSPAYVRWVQQLLNQIMGLRLAVDGVMGPATRSAVRSFQQKQGLTADGIAGPRTETALKMALGATRARPGQAAVALPSPGRVVRAATRRAVVSGPRPRLVQRLPPSPSSLVPPPTRATPRVLSYSTQDVIDKRISIPAQHSLVRLSKNPATSADAAGMLEEVKAGRLAGIYCVNWELSARRAIRLGKSWWTVIRHGEDAILMLDPDDLAAGPPLIAFRRELSPDCGLLKNEQRFAPSPARLDASLLRTWQSYLRFRRGDIQPCSLGERASLSGSSEAVLQSELEQPVKDNVEPPCCDCSNPLPRPPQVRQVTGLTCWAAALSSLLRASPHVLPSNLYTPEDLIIRVRILETSYGRKLLYNDAPLLDLLRTNWPDLEEVGIVYQHFRLPPPTKCKSTQVFALVSKALCEGDYVWLSIHKPAPGFWIWHSWVIFRADLGTSTVSYMDPADGRYHVGFLLPEWDYYYTHRSYYAPPPTSLLIPKEER
jgi:hypothetical protein